MALFFVCTRFNTTKTNKVRVRRPTFAVPLRLSSTTTLSRRCSRRCSCSCRTCFADYACAPFPRSCSPRPTLARCIWSYTGALSAAAWTRVGPASADSPGSVAACVCSSGGLRRDGVATRVFARRVCDSRCRPRPTHTLRSRRRHSRRCSFSSSEPT